MNDFLIINIHPFAILVMVFNILLLGCIIFLICYYTFSAFKKLKKHNSEEQDSKGEQRSD